MRAHALREVKCTLSAFVHLTATVRVTTRLFTIPRTYSMAEASSGFHFIYNRAAEQCANVASANNSEGKGVRLLIIVAAVDKRKQLGFSLFLVYTAAALYNNPRSL